MKRIYSNYSEDDYGMVYELAKELGFTASAFQHYCVMLYAGSKGKTTDSGELVNELLSNIEKIPVGSTFIVSALLSDKWSGLERNMKTLLAKQLALYVRKNNGFEVYKAVRGQTTIYKRIGG